MRFLALKIAFLGGFENDNILSLKSYTVTKSGISPQRKLGSLQNLKLMLIGGEWLSTKMCKDPCMHMRVWAVNARARDKTFALAITTRNRTCVHGSLLVINSYHMSLNFKFRKDPRFCWGDIPVFVTMYDLELKILSFSNPPKNAILSGKKRTLRFIFFKFFLIIIFKNLLSDKQKKRFENPTFISLTRVSRMNMIWGNHLHISNGGLLLVNISHMLIGATINFL